MPSLTNILERYNYLSPREREWLHQLIGDWQVIADIAFADLLLYVKGDKGYVIGAHVRPSTAATLFEHDIVGEDIELDYIEHVEAVGLTGEVLTTMSEDTFDTWVPVRLMGRLIAVLRVASAVSPDRATSQRLENYEEISTALINMVATGEFPLDGAPSSYRHGTPRVADGLVYLDVDGVVLYAAPNAVSNFRRLGVDETIVGSVLAEVVAEHLEGEMPDETLPVVLLGKAAWITETEHRGVVVALRAIPLRHMGKRLGALLLSRDISEMRRRERELLTKDATIKEINHRVKNNLQTVSALLRLQARRAGNQETKLALQQAQRRVEMIAIVHERLSQTIEEVVEFDEVFGSLLRTIRDVAVTEAPVDIFLQGSFGRVRAEQATALAVVLNEVISNAIEHGLPNGGTVEVRCAREYNRLLVQVRDDGMGMDPEALQKKGRGSGLGTNIVRTLVTGELAGSISWEAASPHGTIVNIEAQLRS